MKSSEKPKNRYLARHQWYLSEAQTLVRELQAVAWPANMHVCLGGGVLTHGYSDADLDLYLLPFADVPMQPDAVLNYLETKFGTPYAITGDYSAEEIAAGAPVSPTFLKMVKYQSGRQRIDVFVVRG